MRNQIVAIALIFFAVVSASFGAEGPYYGKFRRLPLTAIHPTGWLRNYLQNQKDGLTGHLEEAGFPFDTVGWGGDIQRDLRFHPKSESDYSPWPAYEQTAYWMDGLLRTGLLLQDDFLLKKARTQIDAVVNGGEIRLPKGATSFLWTEAVFFRALQAEYDATGDQRILDALHKYFLTLKPENIPGKGNNQSDLTHTRSGVLIETILWLYGKTGDEKLLQLAKDGYKLSNTPVKDSDLNEEIKRRDWRFTLWDVEGFLLRDHGVTFLETAKLPALLYLYTGSGSYLRMAHNAQAMLEKFHLLVDGVNSSQEYLNGNQPNASHETCDISDFLWTRSYLLLADGQGYDADAIERAALNAGPSVVSKDFTSHVYCSSPNQAMATSDTGAGRYHYGYHAGHNPECCTGNVNRIMPNYAGHMWLADKNNGLVAALYGPADVEWKVGDSQTPITVESKTEYPFRDKVLFVFKPEKPVRFPFSFRIPGWCTKARALFNGKPVEQELKAGSFVTLDREFQSGDRLELTFPMDVRVSRWGQSGSWQGGIAIGAAVERGPLVFSEDIAEHVAPASDPFRQTDKHPENIPPLRSTPRFQAIDVTPEGTWSYALAVDPHNPGEDIQVVEREMPANPWIKATTPVRLKVPARKVEGMDVLKIKDPWRNQIHYMMPPIPRDFTISDKEQTIDLVPYGSTLIRWTVFPLAEDAANFSKQQMPKEAK